MVLSLHGDRTCVAVTVATLGQHVDPLFTPIQPLTQQNTLLTLTRCCLENHNCIRDLLEIIRQLRAAMKVNCARQQCQGQCLRQRAVVIAASTQAMMPQGSQSVFTGIRHQSHTLAVFSIA